MIPNQGAAIVGDLLQAIQAKALKDETIGHYIKAIRGRVAVQVLDPFTGFEVTRVLKGDITDPNVDKTTQMIPLYTEYDKSFFEKKNRGMIESGMVVPYTAEVQTLQLINAVTDEEIDIALGKKFFAIKALLDKFTSPAPVERLLRRAKELNKKVGTIAAIEVRLATLQEEEYEDS